MEVIEIGNLREAHKRNIDEHLVGGKIRVEVEDKQLPKYGIVISATKRELEKLAKNFLFHKVEILCMVKKPKKGKANGRNTKARKAK